MAESFVEMVKDGEHVVVHPSTVESHKRHGWKISKENVSAPKPPNGKKEEDKTSSANADKVEDKTSPESKAK